MLTLTHESTIKYESPQTVQMDNSRFNTMINANYSQKLSLVAHVTRVESSTICCPNSATIGFLFG